MSLIEADLAETHIYWSKKKSEGVTEVSIDRHLKLIEVLLRYEQKERERVSAADDVRDVLEGTSEFNRGHRAALST